MSHTTLIRSVAIRDVSAIRQAVEKLQKSGIACQLVENRKPRMYYDDQGDRCEYVVNLTGCKYDVGLKLQKDGTYAPMFDVYGRYVDSQIGAHCNIKGATADDQVLMQIGQFMQAYTEAATVNAAVSSGYSVESCETDKEGNLQLVLAQY
jgi:hypothetical protein